MRDVWNKIGHDLIIVEAVWWIYGGQVYSLLLFMFKIFYNKNVLYVRNHTHIYYVGDYC